MPLQYHGDMLLMHDNGQLMDECCCGGCPDTCPDECGTTLAFDTTCDTGTLTTYYADRAAGSTDCSWYRNNEGRVRCGVVEADNWEVARIMGPNDLQLCIWLRPANNDCPAGTYTDSGIVDCGGAGCETEITLYKV